MSVFSFNKKEDGKTIPANPSKWSEKSQNSYATEHIKTYSDDEYQCLKCQKLAVFTAEEQKEAFEVKKLYICTRRKLCQECFMESNTIKRELNQMSKTYSSNKGKYQQDQAFLSKWLELFKTQEKYGAKPNPAMKNMIEKHLKKE